MRRKFFRLPAISRRFAMWTSLLIGLLLLVSALWVGIQPASAQQKQPPISILDWTKPLDGPGPGDNQVCNPNSVSQHQDDPNVMADGVNCTSDFNFSAPTTITYTQNPTQVVLFWGDSFLTGTLSYNVNRQEVVRNVKGARHLNWQGGTVPFGSYLLCEMSKVRANAGVNAMVQAVTWGEGSYFIENNPTLSCNPNIDPTPAPPPSDPCTFGLPMGVHTNDPSVRYQAPACTGYFTYTAPADVLGVMYTHEGVVVVSDTQISVVINNSPSVKQFAFGPIRWAYHFHLDGTPSSVWFTCEVRKVIDDALAKKLKIKRVDAVSIDQSGAVAANVYLSPTLGFGPENGPFYCPWFSYMPVQLKS